MKKFNIKLSKKAVILLSAAAVLLVTAIVFCIIFVTKACKEKKQEQNIRFALETLREELSNYQLSPRYVESSNEGFKMTYEDIGVFAPRFTEEPDWAKQYYAAAKEGSPLLECGVAALTHSSTISQYKKEEIWGLGYAVYENNTAYTDKQYRALLDTLFQVCLNELKET